MKKHITYFGIKRKSETTEIALDAPFYSGQNLTAALAERHRLKKQWWNPKNIKLEGYVDPHKM